MSFKKKFIGFFLSLTSILTLTSALTYASTLGALNASGVNVRSEANINSAVITKYNIGQAVNIIGFKNGFYEIDVDSARLYISSDFVDVLKTEALINGDNVNSRDKASMESRIIDKLTFGQKVVVIGIENDKWVKIEHGNDIAYVNRDFISGDFVDKFVNTDVEVQTEVFVQAQSAPMAKTEETIYAIVSSTTGLRLRSEPSTNSQILSLIPSGMSVDVISNNPGWVQVSYAGHIGYVSEEFVQLKYGSKPTASTTAQQVIEYGKQFLGTPYKWGGNDLKTGVDCSGFVYSTYLKFGVKLNRNSAAMASNGVAVDKANLQAGDLVFFSTTGSPVDGISHVGIYMGNGNFIHSSSSTRTWGVVISSLNEDYYVRNYITARRVL